MPTGAADPGEPAATDAGAAADQASAGETIVQVVEDARAYASAQVDLYKAMAGARLRIARLGIAFGVAATLIAGSALTALLVGSILALAPSVGPGWATLIVVGVALVLAAILGKLAAGRLSRAFGDLE
ncbi:phage holin family protein [Sphingomonas sp.]|uniref:phage holin family protein n=1 Tax=Sphingomonas sp. TaxID=28214 RepID=UPI002DD62D54|nr:phage holin family protein [Sphingomonas sp.]